jgi:hypothetical protein
MNGPGTLRVPEVFKRAARMPPRDTRGFQQSIATLRLAFVANLRALAGNDSDACTEASRAHTCRRNFVVAVDYGGGFLTGIVRGHQRLPAKLLPMEYLKILFGSDYSIGAK